jgi:hypothetical protein
VPTRCVPSVAVAGTIEVKVDATVREAIVIPNRKVRRDVMIVSFVVLNAI